MYKGSIQQRLMGSDFELIVMAPDEAVARKRLDEGVAEIQRIEKLLTVFSETSQTSKLNRLAGIAPVQVDAEVYALIERCIRLSTLTQGAFDITAGALKALYDFKQATFRPPDAYTLRQTLDITGYQHIQMQPGHNVYLQRKGMQIGFGAIGKGYAADRVKALWMAKGVQSGVVNASGDLTAWGSQADGSPWKIGIADPGNKEAIKLWLPVNDASVATSGNYEQYFDLDGIRYSHNIDPRTGRPARFLKSVTIISPGAELSDALATAVTIMGIEVGLDLVQQLPQVHCIIIDDADRIFTSEKIKTHAA